MLYFRLPEGKTPETVRGELPRLANGVGVYGGSEYVVVKNLIAKHFWNDGYNIHNASKNITFENIAAIVQPVPSSCIAPPSLSPSEKEMFSFASFVRLGI